MSNAPTGFRTSRQTRAILAIAIALLGALTLTTLLAGPLTQSARSRRSRTPSR